MNSAPLQFPSGHRVWFNPTLAAVTVLLAGVLLATAGPAIPEKEDTLPLIGRWDELPGVIIAAGHEGLGITTATAPGEVARLQSLGRSEA